MEASGRCYDGSDDSIASSAIAEKGAIQGIGRIKKVDPVKMQVALKKDSEANEFTFSRVWVVPRTVLKLLSEKLGIMNISFLVADEELAAESILIGHPV